MASSINQKLLEFFDDVEGLKKDVNSTQNEIWGNQLRQFFNTTNISQADMKDFERLLGSMRYATYNNQKEYGSMKMFLKLMLRKNLSVKNIQLDSILESMKPIQTIRAQRIQSSLGSPSVVQTNPIPTLTKGLIKTETLVENKSKSNKIFIVHGQDNESKLTLESMLRDMGLNPIILHKQANKGQTVIEKFEEHAGEVNFAFVLFTPDDVGGKKDENKNLKPRARQNVILEFGYFIAKLGRDRVCCLYKKDIELPTDMNGLVYVPFASTPDDSYRAIRQELEAAGYKLK